MEDGLFLLRTSSSYHQLFSLLAQLQVVPPRHCVSRGDYQTGLLWKVEAALEHQVAGLPVPGHLGSAIGRPMPGLDSPGFAHRIAELLETSFLMIWHLGLVTGRSTPLKRHRV